MCAFKVGPDFIDPGYHSRISGNVSRNLDGWMLTEDYNRDTFRKYARASDLAVVEGVMGLFDGYDGRSEAGSTAQMAKWLKLPVLLVVDARSMARSAAALVCGFEDFDQDVDFAGVVFNRIGSRTHLAYLREAVADRSRMHCLGGLPREPLLSLPERHLGLVTTDENPLSSNYIDTLADIVENSLELEAILSGLSDVPDKQVEKHPDMDELYTARIGVARDEAFCFYYQDNLDILESSGAELVFFSPLRDKLLPQGISGLYLGGGYPELFARRLSDNASLRGEIKELGEKGFPIYAECGGFMFLCRGIQDTEGDFYPMAGAYPFAVRMLSRLKSLGYREVCLASRCPLGIPGQVIRGHEFHYSEMIEGPGDVQHAYRIMDRRGDDKYAEGFLVKNTLGSYVHLHFGSNPGVAKNFVRLCWEKGNAQEVRGDFLKLKSNKKR